jgi:hypothetical protein
MVTCVWLVLGTWLLNRKPENESKLPEIMRIYLPIFALFFSNYIQISTNKYRICLQVFVL